MADYHIKPVAEVHFAGEFRFFYRSQSEYYVAAKLEFQPLTHIASRGTEVLAYHRTNPDASTP